MVRRIRDSSDGFSPAVAARARKIRVLLMDVDGVLTAGQVYLLPLADGVAVEMKAFHSQDGAGLKLARDAGLRTGVISGRQSAAMTRRAEEVGMEFVFQGRSEKVAAYEEILRIAGVRDSEVAYIGDDLPDLPILQRVGLAPENFAIMDVSEGVGPPTRALQAIAPEPLLAMARPVGLPRSTAMVAVDAKGWTSWQSQSAQSQE